MACSLPYTDSEVEALVLRLFNEDKGRQDALLELAFQFEDSCVIRDDLRKAYEKCTDISQESRALICTFLKESSRNDHKLHLSMYGKASRIGCSSSQANFYLTEKELHQLRMDEEALRETLEEEAMNKKSFQVGNFRPEFKLSYLWHGLRKDESGEMSYLVPMIAVVFVVVVSSYLASVPQEEDQQFIIVILGFIMPLIILAIVVEACWKE
ncbi:hypothetical protein Tco_1054100 [Tanacetum coccineum]|uniref:Uncharacterized protein n=1 Tax=Tanacetum coccineum TaxID=301880 RepID=A0ABQ5GVW6_9ASTR